MAQISIDDKYELNEGVSLMSGSQALIRVALEQARRDRAAGLNTAGFISGYRGSPLGVLDSTAARAAKWLKAEGIRFRPGVNEEIAATSVYGSQQVGFFPGARHDGVFAMWYGKGPGVDRAGDALKHGNLAGTSRHGGVLVLAGDDHGAKSSTTCHQSEQALVAAFIPILYPANVQEYLDFGLLGYAMSRYSGLWIGLKCVSDTADSTSTVELTADRGVARKPFDVMLPTDGLNIRKPDTQSAQEQRMVRHRLPAAQAFARANGVDRVVLDGGRRGVGVVAAGKAYLDTMQALRRLGIDEARASELGLRVYKPGLIWPLEPQALRDFARGHREILVIEEKRSFVEAQIRDLLYDLQGSDRPRIVGKTDESGSNLLPSDGELGPELIAQVIKQRLKLDGTGFADAIGDNAVSSVNDAATDLIRTPFFCSGCPHNTSTKVPEGATALSGIGCHVMAAFMPDRPTAWPVQMGGEGANWIGISPFTDTEHVFQNLGDGTYFHSGSLAIRAAIASGVNITYKILFNDAVAMTGGQPVDGILTVQQIAHQLIDEGVSQVVVVADDPNKYPAATRWPAAVVVRPRTELLAVQRELAAKSGVTALIYDQVCAAEKRRRRKRGEFADPPRRIFINELVCEGCGDCGVKSNCVSIQPLETEFGRKRMIDQSSCNKDYSCINGFCPSFVTVHGGDFGRGVTGGRLESWSLPQLPEPKVATAKDVSVLVTGVGGTGVVTVGAVLAMAAHIDGQAASVLDITGLSQKNGAVLSHIRIASSAPTILTTKIGAGEADVLLGCDIVAAGSRDAMATLRIGATSAVVNSHAAATAAFTRLPDLKLSAAPIAKRLRELCDPNATTFVDASQIAVTLLGDTIGANILLLGAAVQMGMLPISRSALEAAIRLNGAAVEMNLKAFALGRWAAVDPKAVQALVDQASGIGMPKAEIVDQKVDELVRRRAEFLSAYQNEAYADRYRALVERVRRAEGTEDEALTRSVALAYFKLLAYKDEYEVARLFTDGEFDLKLRQQFDGDIKVSFHLAPPLLAKRDPVTGEPRKIEFGSWLLPAMKLLSRFKWLRGTSFDPFGFTAERRMERRLISEYEVLIETILSCLTLEKRPLALELARLPLDIRGFGHVKEANVERIERRKAELLEELQQAPSMTPSQKRAVA